MYGQCPVDVEHGEEPVRLQYPPHLVFVMILHPTKISTSEIGWFPSPKAESTPSRMAARCCIERAICLKSVWAGMLTSTYQSPIRGQALWGWQELLQVRLKSTSVALLWVA